MDKILKLFFGLFDITKIRNENLSGFFLTYFNYLKYNLRLFILIYF